MTTDELDDLVRRANPPVAVSEDRVGRLAETVLRCVESRQPTGAAGDRWTRTAWWRLVPVARFAVPMAVAGVLGLAVSRLIDGVLPVLQFTSLLLSTSLLPMGS